MVGIIAFCIEIVDTARSDARKETVDLSGNAMNDAGAAFLLWPIYFVIFFAEALYKYAHGKEASKINAEKELADLKKEYGLE